MTRRIWMLIVAGILFVPAASPARAQSHDARQVPIVFHVATVDGQLAASESFVAEQLAHANRIYGALGIELVDAGHLALHTRHARLVSRADRDALAPYVQAGVINCMVVASLMDVDEPGRERRGVHWHVRQGPRVHFVVVSAISGPYVLAHELGHFLGNREHSETPGNLMSYRHTDATPFLDGTQVVHAQATLTQMLISRELVAR